MSKMMKILNLKKSLLELKISLGKFLWAGKTIVVSKF